MAGCKVAKGVDGEETLKCLRSVVDAISRTGVGPSSDVQRRLAESCVHGKNWKMAAQLFESLVSTK